MSSAVVTMREVSGGRKAQHAVAHVARVVAQNGVLVLRNWPQTEEYFAAPIDLVGHVEIRSADS